MAFGKGLLVRGNGRYFVRMSLGAACLRSPAQFPVCLEKLYGAFLEAFDWRGDVGCSLLATQSGLLTVVEIGKSRGCPQLTHFLAYSSHLLCVLHGRGLFFFFFDMGLVLAVFLWL